jgi:hypothetical protein
MMQWDLLPVLLILSIRSCSGKPASGKLASGKLAYDKLASGKLAYDKLAAKSRTVGRHAVRRGAVPSTG